MIERDFNRLMFLARCEASLKHALCRTAPVGFGDLSPDENRDIIETLRGTLADRPVLRNLLDRFLLAQWLLHGDALPAGWWADVLADLPMPERSSPCADRSRPWRDVPVLIADNRTCHVRRFILAAVFDPPDPGLDGRPVSWPDWADAVLSDGSKTAILDAAAACRRMLSKDPAPRWFLYPLVPANDAVQITGRSLGLPLALGLLSSAMDAPLPADIAATGGVSAEGMMTPVGAVTRKRRTAGREGFSALLCPSENARFPQAGDPLILPARDLRQAWMIARLYDPARADRLIGFSTALQDPRLFIDAVETVDPEWLVWAREHGYTDAATDAILGTPRLLAALTDRLEAFAYRSDATRADAVADLLPADRFDSAAKGAPLSAFRWCAANLSIANHRGRISAARRWSERAERLLDAAGRADISAAADYFNHAFIARHNRYHFTPDPPAPVRRFLDLLERQYAIQCEFGCPTHPLLGRLYGSISQNYGFCGPDHLERMWGYCEKARRALGEGTVPEFRDEWARHYNYMTYALLDAGDRKRAAGIFFTYLESDDPEAIFGRLAGFTPWEHALAARFLAETGGAHAGRYLDWCDAHLKTPPRTEHPWQLWCVNLGRIAVACGAETAAEGWFRKGLDLCRSPAFGATVRVMALMPLAGLRALNRLDDREMRAERDAIRAAAGKLHPGYFDGVFSVPFERALDDVWRRPERLFPFNYR